MNPQDFQQAMAQYGPQQQDQSQDQPLIAQPTATPAAPQQHGNWFTHLLPTIGGIGGGILGAVFGGGVGGIGGGAGGSALGKTLENSLEGQSLGHDVALNAAEGGIGEGVGGAVGKVAGKALGAVGAKSGQVADDLVKGQVAKGAMGSDTANALRTVGATDARQWQPIAEQVTGQNGALNQGVEKALMTSGSPVDVSGLIGSKISPTGMAENLISGETALTDTTGNKILNTVNKSVQNMLGGPDGMVGNQLADPLDVKREASTLRGLAMKASDAGYRNQDANLQGAANVYHGLADELENRVYNPGGQQVPLTDDVKAGIISNLSPLKDINPTVHNSLVDGVNNASTLQDLRSMQAPFVKASQAVTATEKAADKGAGTTASQAVGNLPMTGAMAAGPHGALAGVGAMALRSPTADRALVPLVQNGGALLSNAADASLGKAGVPALVGGAGGILSGTSNNMIQGSNIGNTMQQDPNANAIAPAAAQTAPAGGLSRDDLITLALYSPNAFNSVMSAAAPQQQQVAAANSAETALQGLGSAPGGGILSHVMGNLGIGHTGEYQRQAQSAAQQIAAALPGTDSKQIERELTNYNAGSGNINAAIQGVLQRLSSVVNQNKDQPYEQLMNYQGNQQPGSVMGQVPVTGV